MDRRRFITTAAAGTTVYAPRVRLTPAGGREVVFVSRVATSPPKLAAGDPVQVR